MRDSANNTAWLIEVHSDMTCFVGMTLSIDRVTLEEDRRSKCDCVQLQPRNYFPVDKC